jgi:hypothetical protein
MNENIVAQLQRATSDVQRTWVVTSAVLETLPRSMAEALLAAAIPHWFNATALSVLLDVNAEEAEDIYQNMRKLSLTEAFGTQGYAVHDLTRTSILAQLTSTQDSRFLTYSRHAYDYFCRFDDPQNAVEAMYHLLAIDPRKGLEKFKMQMGVYRRESNFSAAHNLVRNAQELIKLGLLTGADATEIEHQN